MVLSPAVNKRNRYGELLAIATAGRHLSPGTDVPCVHGDDHFSLRQSGRVDRKV